VQVKEADLTMLLTPAGFVWELTLPKKDDGEHHEPCNSSVRRTAEEIIPTVGAFIGTSVTSMVHLLTAGTSKGFAFASFTSRAHSERAIKLVNGKVGFSFTSPSALKLILVLW